MVSSLQNTVPIVPVAPVVPTVVRARVQCLTVQFGFYGCWLAEVKGFLVG
jgi:hypothetical protein